MIRKLLHITIISLALISTQSPAQTAAAVGRIPHDSLAVVGRYITVTNTLDFEIRGQIVLIVTDSASDMLEPDGYTAAGEPYLNLPGLLLAPGEARRVRLDFANWQSEPDFTARVELLPLDPTPVTYAGGPNLTLDPVNLAPLAAVVQATTSEQARAIVHVVSGNDRWVVKFPDYENLHTLPIYGLKPDEDFEIEVAWENTSGEITLASSSLTGRTAPLPDDFPLIQVRTSDPERMSPGFTVFDRLLRAPGSTLPTYTIILDDEGDVVWYSSTGAQGTSKFMNGNLWWPGSVSREVNLLGLVSREINLSEPEIEESGTHHDWFPTLENTIISPSTRFIEVDDYPASTDDPSVTQTAQIEDNPIVEFDEFGSQFNQWNLSDMLDVRRIGYDATVPFFTPGLDWAHANSAFHHPVDNSIVVSVRHQDAVIKFSRATGQLEWILGTHANWGPGFQQYLLTPVGEGDFEWQYHQHAASITPVGSVLLFDNGNHRASPFDGLIPMAAADSYSRAVEYWVDESNMTIQQMWEYRGPPGERLFSNFVSDADYLNNQNILVTFGGLRFINGVSNAAIGRSQVTTRVIEVDRSSGSDEEVFDVEFYDETPANWMGVYRSERTPSLYPYGVRVTYDHPYRAGGQ